MCFKTLKSEQLAVVCGDSSLVGGDPDHNHPLL